MFTGDRAERGLFAQSHRAGHATLRALFARTADQGQRRQRRALKLCAAAISYHYRLARARGQLVCARLCARSVARDPRGTKTCVMTPQKPKTRSIFAANSI